MNGHGHGQSNGSISTSHSNGPESPNNARPSYRHSLDLKYYDGSKDSTQVSSPPMHQATPPKLQSSFSANDVPTLRSTNGATSANGTPNSHAQQHLHNHNASLGRIPPNAMNNRLSREMTSSESNTLREAQNGYQSIQSALQASAPPFGPSLGQTMSQAPMQQGMTSPTDQQAYPVGGYYPPNNGYNMQMMTMGMQNMNMGQQVYSPHNPYAPPQNYGAVNMYPQQNGARDSQARVIQQRRQNDGEGTFPFPSIYNLLHCGLKRISICFFFIHFCFLDYLKRTSRPLRARSSSSSSPSTLVDLRYIISVVSCQKLPEHILISRSHEPIRQHVS